MCGAIAPLMDVHTITEEDRKGQNYRLVTTQTEKHKGEKEK